MRTESGRRYRLEGSQFHARFRHGKPTRTALRARFEQNFPALCFRVRGLATQWHRIRPGVFTYEKALTGRAMYVGLGQRLLQPPRSVRWKSQSAGVRFERYSPN
jgi:hypothetical protein